MRAVTIDELTNAVDEVDFNDGEMIYLADEMIRLTRQLEDVLERKDTILERNARNGKTYAALLALVVRRATWPV
jgi:hypothetical protein